MSKHRGRERGFLEEGMEFELNSEGGSTGDLDSEIYQLQAKTLCAH